MLTILLALFGVFVVVGAVFFLSVLIATMAFIIGLPLMEDSQNDEISSVD
jgi:hypothetical protein